MNKNNVPDLNQGCLVSTLSKKTNLCRNWLRTLTIFNPYWPLNNVLVIDDGVDWNSLLNDYPDTMFMPGIKPFVFSKNANLAFLTAYCLKMDLFLCNDDTSFSKLNTIYQLQQICNINKEIGILSPVFNQGVGNIRQTTQYYDNSPHQWVDELEILCFVAVYIPFRTIQKVGLMCEKFDHQSYGWEDNEYCDRVLASGLKLAITPKVEMLHGTNTRPSSNTYAEMPGFNMMVQKGKLIYEIEQRKKNDSRKLV